LPPLGIPAIAVHMYSSIKPGKTRARSPEPRPPLRSTRLLDPLRECIRYRHYSIGTEQAYVHWVRRFIHFRGRKHPASMGAPEVQGFRAWLAAGRGVAAPAHRQALSALLFLYREVLSIDLPWLSGIGRPKLPQRLPCVRSRDEVQSSLRRQLARSHDLRPEDRAAARRGVWLPDALARKYPRADRSWTWHRAWPAPPLSHDPRTGIERRHHLLESGSDIRTVQERGPVSPVRAQHARHQVSGRQPRPVTAWRSGSSMPASASPAGCTRTAPRLRCTPCREVHSWPRRAPCRGTVWAQRAPRRQAPGHSDVSTTMIYAHVLDRGAAGVASPQDRLV